MTSQTNKKRGQLSAQFFTIGGEPREINNFYTATLTANGCVQPLKETLLITKIECGVDS